MNDYKINNEWCWFKCIITDKDIARSISDILLYCDSLLPLMFSEQVCSFNKSNHFALKLNPVVIMGKKHSCENREAKADEEDWENKRKPHCGHSNKKVISLLCFDRKQSLSAFWEPFYTKHCAYTSSLLPSSNNETKTEDKLSISDYTPFKFNTHNFRCLLPPSCCIDSS